MVDDIPTVKFVYIQWVGETTKPMDKAKSATHKGAVEEVFSVSATTIPWPSFRPTGDKMSTK